MSFPTLMLRSKVALFISVVFLVLANLIARSAMSQQWKFIAPMKHARARHHVVQLLDGRILVAGGRVGDEILRSCEIYDPTTDVWTDADSMNIGRFGFEMNRMYDGRILVSGGLTDAGNSTTATCEIFDPATNKWSFTSPMSDRREQHMSVEVSGNKIVLLGGLDGNTAQYLQSCDIYDEATGTMSRFPTMPSVTARANALYLPHSNSILLAGGYYGGFNGYQLATTQRYFFSTSKWALADSMLESQGNFYNMSVQSGTDRVFAVSGDLNTQGTRLTGTVEYFDPDLGTWVGHGSVPPTFANYALAIGNDTILNLGGQDSLYAPLGTTTWYDRISGKSWSGPSLLEALNDNNPLVVEVPEIERPCTVHRRIYTFAGASNTAYVTSSCSVHCEVLDLGNVPATPSISVSPSILSLSNATPCDSSHISLQIITVRCNTIYLDSILVADSTHRSLMKSQLPMALLRDTSNITIIVPSTGVPLASGIDLYFNSAGVRTSRHIGFLNSNVIVPGLDIPSDLKFSGNLCSSYDTTIQMQNTGCDSLEVDQIRVIGTDSKLFKASRPSFAIPPGGRDSIHVTFSPSIAGTANAMLAYEIHQYGHSWDSTLAIAATTSNEKPYTIRIIVKDVKDAHPGDTIEVPVYLISNLASAVSLQLDLKYNTDLLEQLNPNPSGTALDGIPLSDLKERSGGSTFFVPTGFPLNGNTPLLKLRFRVAVSDTISSPIIVSQLSLGAGSIPIDQCLAITQDTALVTVDLVCGEEILSSFMRVYGLGGVSLEATTSGEWICLNGKCDGGRLDLIDVIGQTVSSAVIDPTLTSQRIRIPTNLRNGVYFLRVSAAGMEQVRKVVIVH